MNESIVDFARFTTRSVSGDSVYIRALRSIRRMHILTAPEARGISAHYTVEVNSAYHAYRCVRSHDQSIWKNGKFDPSSWVVVENPSKIGPPNFDGAIGEVWVFLLTHTHRQSVKQILSSRLQITNMEGSETFMAQNAWFYAMCLLGVLLMTNHV